MYKTIKRYALKYSLKKHLRVLSRHKYFFNFNNAEKIGIVYTYRKGVGEAVRSLMDYFKSRNIKVDVLCYYNEKEIPEGFVTSPRVNVFCKRDVNWYGRPLLGHVFEFIKTPFDILIDFDLDNTPVTNYIVTLSVAKMKAGRSAYNGNPYDFVLSTGDKIDHLLFVEQLKHYMLTIDMKND
ncbi:MAG: hypothetical protein LBT61_03840 [Prevotellaceae bacterium]|jgi:hypothetical protein|nr:hypothetical protein [Prevotellaceae bacterium]